MRILAALLLLVSASVGAAPNCEHHPDDDRIALACNVYWEARSETVEGMMAVVAVTLNRVGSWRYPNTVREVVWQRKQFSWTHDGKVDRPKNRPSWKQALQISSRFTITKYRKMILCPTATQIIAQMVGRPDPGCDLYRNLVNVHVILAQMADPTGGALYYHAQYIPPPYWVFGKPSAVIGKHIFYTAARMR